MMADIKRVKKQRILPNKRHKIKNIIANRKNKKHAEIDEEIQRLSSQYNEVSSEGLKNFSDFPLSAKSKKGLENGKFSKPTDIQKQSLLLSLQGNDILGAAKTGSGKTLAFLMPVLEILYREKWTQLDGLGALIISPTRELAFQTFEVLKVVGKFHDFSAGLVIGGKHLKEEAERINRTNIVICTPGRLLQHMDQTVNFHADNLQVLVLDEADRILDLGFKESMNAIIENLPPKRQTLLFSATQTKSVKDLARLSLKNPMYISVHENAKHSTPTQLQQSFIVCELHEKLDLLWSFIRNHLKKKILVFLSSCKQVRFVYEVFRKLQPGNTVLCLHGAMQQMKRVAMYEAFCRKQSAVLFATDIAARGLDFPAVHWVIQLDCPEDANTYIHRVGRTARYEQDGEALLMLLPSEEEAMLKQITDKKIPIDRIRVNPNKMGSIQRKLDSLCASEIQLKEFAKRAFVSYLKAVFFMSNKAVFNVKKLDTDKFASCLGLAIPPRIRFLQKELQRQKDKLDSSEKTKLLGKLNEGDKVTHSTDAFAVQKQFSGSSEDSDSGSDSQSDVETQANSVNTNVFRVSQGKSVAKQEVNSGSDELSDSESFDTDSESVSGESCDKSLQSPGDGYTKERGVDEVGKDDGKQEKTSKLRSEKEEGGEYTSFSLGDLDDETDDLLLVKKKASEKMEEEDSEDCDDILEERKRRKALTKAAIAKKIMKKNLTVNTKITFDEEGQEVCNVMKTSTVLSDEEEDVPGGIRIEEARKRMEREDKVDREIYRQRIKDRHKEKKIKEKEKRRAEAELRKQKHVDEEVAVLAGPGDQEDSFHSEDEDSEGHGSDDTSDGEERSVDSSDYSDMVKESVEDDSDEEGGNVDSGEVSSEEEEEEGQGQQESDMEEMSQTSKSSRKRKGQETYQKLKKKKADEEFNTGLTLMDDEQIALKLLQN